jgi:hypothetical protein
MTKDYELLLRVDFTKDADKIYRGRHIEVRKVGKQIRFYEVNGSDEYCISKETIKFLIKNRKLNLIDLYL